MPTIITPQRWERQPQTFAGPDYGNPINIGLHRMWNGANGTALLDLVTGTRGTVNGSPILSGVRDSLAYDNTIASTCRVDCGNVNQATSGGLSVGILVVPMVTTRSDFISVWNTGSSAGDQFVLLGGITSSTVSWYISRGAGGANGRTGPTYSTGELCLFFGTAQNNGTSCLQTSYKNGVRVDQSNVPSFNLNATPSTNLLIGNNVGLNGYANAKILWAGVWDRCLADSEISTIGMNPWQLLAPVTQRIYSFAITAGALQITPGAGTVALTGLAPSLATAETIGAGSIALTGAAPSVTQNAALTPGAGALTLTGTAPALDMGVVPGAGAISLSGYQTTVQLTTPGQITPSVGAVTLSGLAPSLATAETIAAASVALTGAAPSLDAGVGTGSGTLTLNGLQPSVSVTANNIVVAPGTLALAGYAPSVSGGASVGTGIGPAGRARGRQRQRRRYVLPNGLVVDATPDEVRQLVRQLIPDDVPEEKKDEIVSRTQIRKRVVKLPRVELDDGFKAAPQLKAPELFAPTWRQEESEAIAYEELMRQHRARRRRMKAAILLLS